MPRVRLTQSFISSQLIVPDGKDRIEYVDDQVQNFFIEVRATSQGQGTFYVRYRDKATNTTRYTKIARTSEVTLVDARAKAKTLLAEIALGADPRADLKAKKEVLTLDSFVTEQLWPYIDPRKRSADRDHQLYKRVGERFGDKRLNQITRQQVQTFHTDLLAGGLSPASCDHHVKFMRSAFNQAVQWALLDKNPISKIKLFNPDNRVENLLDENQLERLVTVLRTDANRPVCQICLFLLSTGCRLNEALSATWDQIDRENRVWRIPAATSKSKRIRSVPLNDSALDVLTEVGGGTSGAIFVSSTGERYGRIDRTWYRLRALAGLGKIRLHDLRHQYASFLVNAGHSLYEVQQILGHSSPIVTQRYAHLSSKSLQDAANSASKMIKAATVAPTSSAPVLQLVPQPLVEEQSSPVLEEVPPKAAA